MGFIGDILSGEKKETFSPLLSPAQRRLVQQQLDLGEFQLEELRRQREQQTDAFAGAEESVDQFDELVAGFGDEGLVDEAIDRAISAGERGILGFQERATEQLREELAPSLGLRPGDTPVLDRGSRIAAESLRQRGELGDRLESQRASSLLGLKEFQANLRDRAFANRLQLAGARSQAGLGLAGVSQPNASALLANQGGIGKSRDPARGFSAVLGGTGGFLTGLGSI